MNADFHFQPANPADFVVDLLDGTDVTAWSHPFEAYAGVARAFDWNHTPAVGARASPYCKCGRAKTDDEMTCLTHRKREQR